MTTGSDEIPAFGRRVGFARINEAYASAASAPEMPAALDRETNDGAVPFVSLRIECQTFEDASRVRQVALRFPGGATRTSGEERQAAFRSFMAATSSFEPEPQRARDRIACVKGTSTGCTRSGVRI